MPAHSSKTREARNKARNRARAALKKARPINHNTLLTRHAEDAHFSVAHVAHVRKVRAANSKARAPRTRKVPAAYSHRANALRTLRARALHTKNRPNTAERLAATTTVNSA